MTIQLRPYQQEAVNKIRESLRNGKRHPLLVLPTGGGKTAIASELIRLSYNKQKSSIFICHRQELLTQTYNTYLKNGITPSLIASGIKPDYNNPMQIALINTLSRRLDVVNKPDLIFLDECQHQRSSTWEMVCNYFPDSIVVGLSATPCRLDGKPLGKFFDDMIETVSTKWLIEHGYLSPYLYYAPSMIDTSELQMSSNGDYSKESLSHASFNARIIGDNIEQYKRLALGKRNIVFAINRVHAQDITSRYRQAGIIAEYLDGDTPKAKRKAVVKAFADGDVQVLVNVDLFGEGFDIPTVEVVSLLRPTASTSLYLQQVGRGLRIAPEIGKQQAIILDHVNNYQRHGMPDAIHEWSLDEGLRLSRRRGEQSSIAIRRCPECFFAHPPALVCPNCGHIYKADGQQIKEIAGELVLIGSEEARQAQKKEVIIAESLSELVRIESDRGFKKYWAEKQWQLKTGENLWSSLDGLEKIAQARNYQRGWAWLQWKRRI